MNSEVTNNIFFNMTRILEVSDKRIKIGPCFMWKELIPAKLIYLFSYANMGATLPYATAFLVSVGLSVTQAGLIMGLRLIPALFAIPLFGAIADHFGKHKLVSIVITTIAGLATFPNPWIAKAISYNADANVTVASNSSVGTLSSYTKGNQLLFYTLLLMMAGSGVFGIPQFSFIDSAVMHLVKRCKNATYGQQRVFAPVGFALGSFFAGFVSDRYSDPTMSKYTGAFCVFGITISLTIILLFALDQSRSDGKLRSKNDAERLTGKIRDDAAPVESKKKKSKTFKKLFKTCRDLRVVFFLLIVCHMGINFFLVNGYMVLLMEEMESSKTTIGIATAMSPVFELMTFPVSSTLIKWIGGNYPSFFIAAASYSLRFLLMSFIQNPWLFLPVQCFQSFGYAVFWVSANEYTFAICSKDISASMFTIVSSIYFSLGGLIGGAAGGKIYQTYGGPVLYRAASLNSAFMTILIIAFYYKFEKRFAMSKTDEENNCLTLKDTV